MAAPSLPLVRGQGAPLWSFALAWARHSSPEPAEPVPAGKSAARVPCLIEPGPAKRSRTESASPSWPSTTSSPAPQLVPEPRAATASEAARARPAQPPPTPAPPPPPGPPLGEALPAEAQAALGRLQAKLGEAGGAPGRLDPELAFLRSAPAPTRAALLAALGAPGLLSDEALALLTLRFLGVGDSAPAGPASAPLSYAAGRELVALVLLPRVAALAQPAGRSLLQTVLRVAQQAPRLVVEALLVPLLADQQRLGAPQAEVLQRVVRECLDDPLLLLLLQDVLAAQPAASEPEPGAWTELAVESVARLVAALRSPMPPALLDSLLARAVQARAAPVAGLRLAGSLKFANLLLSLAMRHAASPAYQRQAQALSVLLSQCTSYLARSALQKLSAQMAGWVAVPST